MRRTWVQDETGAAGLVAPPDFPTDLRADEQLALERLTRSPWIKWFVALFLLTFVSGLLLIPLLHKAGPPLARAAFIVVSTAWFASTMALIMPPLAARWTGARDRALARTWLKLGRCPWCTFDLRHAPIETDELSRCTECGGRWRIRAPKPR
jgi:hypothetical protein